MFVEIAGFPAPLFNHRLRDSGVQVLAVLTLLCSLGNPVFSQEGGTSIEFQAQQRINSLCKTDPAFQGAFILARDLNPDANDGKGEFELEVVIDSSRTGPESQLELIRKELDRYEFAIPHRITKVHRVPLDSLFEEFNIRIAADTRLDGCFIAGAYFESPETLILLGRITNAEQQAVMDTLGESILIQENRGQPLTSGKVSDFSVIKAIIPSALTVKTPTVVRGQQLFADGITHFRRCRFEQALDSFRHAIIESPKTPEYRYWQILTLMRLNRDGVAYAHMLAYVLRGEPSFYTFGRIQRSLERIQGPTRMDLIALEVRVKKDVLAQIRLASRD